MDAPFVRNAVAESAEKEPTQSKTPMPQGLRRSARILSMLLRIAPKTLVAGRMFIAEVVNRHMLDYDDRLIVVGNHRSNLDPLYVWTPQDKPAVFVAKAELWPIPVVGQIMRVLGHIPVKRRDKASRENVMVAGKEILEKNGRLIIFFEGTTHQLPYDGPSVLGKTYEGATRLAIETNTPILACGLRGTSEVKNLFTAIFRRPKVRTAFAPTYLHPDYFVKRCSADPKNATEEEISSAAYLMMVILRATITDLVQAPTEELRSERSIDQ